jgi:hypothetical protein
MSEITEELVVSRIRWDRGTGTGKLYDGATGHRCIVGFYLEKHGVDPKLMDGMGEPYKLCDEYPELDWEKFPIAVVEKRDEPNTRDYEYQDTAWTALATQVNDNDLREDPDRERLLIEHFASQGCKLTFVDEED